MYCVFAWSAGRAAAQTNVFPEHPRDLDFPMPAAETIVDVLPILPESQSRGACAI